MSLILDGEALDMLARLQAIEIALGDLAAKATLTADLNEITAEIQALRNEVGGIQQRFQDLKARYEQLAVRVTDLE